MKKSKDNYYFTAKTDESIKRFVESNDEEERHKIFNEEIRPVFETLIKNLIHVYKFHKLDDVDTLMRDCLTNLYELIPKYDFSKGTKCFSYFNVVAKNWFIHKARQLKKNTLEGDLIYGLDHEMVRSDPSLLVSSFEDKIMDREFWVALDKEIDTWGEKLSKSSEKKVLEGVVFLLRHTNLASIYSKKAIYLYLRDITGLNMKQVATNLKKIKDLYEKWKEDYFSGKV